MVLNGDYIGVSFFSSSLSPIQKFNILLTWVCSNNVYKQSYIGKFTRPVLLCAAPAKMVSLTGSSQCCQECLFPCCPYYSNLYHLLVLPQAPACPPKQHFLHLGVMICLMIYVLHSDLNSQKAGIIPSAENCVIQVPKTHLLKELPGFLFWT